MVAYAYAAQFPAEVTKLVLMDAFLPGVPGWEAVYNDPNIWHFRFNRPTPEALVQGREPTYFAYFWNEVSKNTRKNGGSAKASDDVASQDHVRRLIGRTRVQDRLERIDADHFSIHNAETGR